MRIQPFSCLSLLHFCLILLCIDFVSVSGQCLKNQQLILIQLKNTISFDSSFSTKITSWHQRRDCCSWKGVNCSADGHVIGLDLSGEGISGGIENSSPLFSLQFLRSLNLEENSFYSPQIPPAIGNLTNLVYLNLKNAGFKGQIPGELSNLIKLVTLDLSCEFLYGPTLILGNSSLAVLLQNLPELTELYLDGVDLSTQGYDWCQAISFSLPKLIVLSLTDCLLSGPIDASFAKLQSLSVIDLSRNNLSGPVPEFLANFTNLTILKLSDCQLNGHFPGTILQVPTLITLDLSHNHLLDGFLPMFPQNASLQTLVLSFTNFSKALPVSIGNLRMLSWLELHDSYFSGQIPHSMESLTQLVNLDLKSNKFSGPIPSFQKSKNLNNLVLSHNGLSGPIPNTYFEGMVNLESVVLEFNAFNGSIPSSLFGLSSLKNIQLSNNNFHGLLANFSNSSLSLLHTLDLSSNGLEGPIPKSFFDLRWLDILSLSNNLLNGTVELEAFSGLWDLTVLDLSYNNLSIETRGVSSSMSNFPQLVTLNLASCKLKYFPDLGSNFILQKLDLSDNQIGGEIPSWIWEIANVREGNLRFLNLSHNELVNLQEPYFIPTDLNVLDLHANQLHGNIPIPGVSAYYVDYSFNFFNSSLPDEICSATFLSFLDLSSSYLSGTIPSCFIEMIGSRGLVVLKLGNNNLSGNIPDIFPRDCGLETLDLHGNHLEGKVPESLGNCYKLEVLDLGKNLLNDTFPCFLMKKCTEMHVLSLRSNKLHGNIQCRGATKVWSKLQIIDIASNYFMGYVPRSFFRNWTAMIENEDGEQSKSNYLQPTDMDIYFDKVTVVIKGDERELVKILTIFSSIDLSNNRFSGEIPGSIGELKALYILNMSHNAFRGTIPASIGNLKELGSLDLSVNHLAGRIPTELAGLTFLGFLNLSYNLLEGRIPAGQLQTFTEASFEGNKGLCGSQLNISCVGEQGQGLSPPPSEEGDGKGETNGFLISFEVGIVVGLATVIAPLVLSRRWSKWYFEQVDRIVAAKVYQYYQRRNQERKKPIRFP